MLLGRWVTSESEYTQQQTYGLPFKTTAPEALRHKKFSTKSDVWAFGVLCWEIIHCGEDPFPSATSKEVLSFIDSGKRLESRDPHCPNKLKK